MGDLPETIVKTTTSPTSLGAVICMVTVACGLRWRFLSAEASASLPFLGAANVFLANGQPWPWQTSAIFEPLGRWLSVSSVAKLNDLPNAQVYAGERWMTPYLKVRSSWSPTRCP